MKRCATCKRRRNIRFFTINRSKADGLNHICRECQSKYGRAHYRKNKPAYLKKALKHNAQMMLKLRAMVDEAKSKPCVDCKVQYPLVAMDLDHVRGKKAFTIAQVVHAGISAERLRAEIAKCEVRCSNCHRIKTHTKRPLVKRTITQVYET